MFDDPFVIRDRDIAISASIGWAVSRGDQTAEVLLRSADTAMYRAKDRGKGRAERFEDELHADAFARFELKGDLTRALEHNQFICHYQPIVSLETGRITGTEALVRWQHPDRGLIPPNLFIPLAEETGQIVTLGRIVLEEACRQLRQWQLLLAADATLSMSVNVSVRQLAHAALVREVRSAIAESGIDPSTLTLEITETTLMQDTDDNLRRLHELRDLGVSLAVDDFGTGYSSLGYVQRFPVDIIKLDRSFVSGLGSSPGEGAVVLSMIELAQRLGVHTVAEGIDRPEQVPVLRRLGADLGQGYLFSPPATASTITALLTELDAHVALPPG
jgi:EAL domain-containing protein (putative c-di-GMP-specific phosphodiesterase class I)